MKNKIKALMIKSDEMQVNPNLPVKSAYDPKKATMQITPADRNCLEVFISRAYQALVVTGSSKEWATKKAYEWDTSKDPKYVIPDIMKYLNIELIESKPAYSK